MNEYLEDKLMRFLRTALKPFSILNLLDYLEEPQSRFNIEEYSSYLIYNQLAYLYPETENEKDVWISRAALFTGKKLVITPSPDEIAKGVFIPGSRFVPFYNPAVLPHELTFEYKGKKLGRKVISGSPDELYLFYSLLGDEYAPQYLAFESNENAERINNLDEYPEELTISVISMDSIYWSSGFKPGDRIIVQVKDWNIGLFELDILHENDIDPEKEKKWLTQMEKSLIQSFEIAGPCACIDEQLAFAFFLGQDVVFTPYAISLEFFLNWTKKISLEPYGVESRLWFTGEVIPSHSSWNMAIITSPSSLLEEALVHLRLPLSPHIVDICIFDALFRKEPDASALLHRLLPDKYCTDFIYVPVVERYIRRRFKDSSATYNWFADQEFGSLRNRYVELHNALMTYVFSLEKTGFEPDEIPDQGAVVLAQLMTHALSALENLDTSSDIDPIDIDSLWASIEGMEESFFEAKTAIQEALPDMNKKRFSVIRKEGNRHA